ncbi:YSIRK-type signal peptide-containing protein, partial [Staphylococcus caeli]|uniref:YSIRK-type signal peptide-containing protein n=1 Tax=Staphylococcus caeli TaxID=2201815 RepID=UPI003F55B2E1
MKIFREYISRRQNRYSIRKFTIGTASILLGSLLIMGNNNEASASEESKLTKSEIDFNNDIKQFKDLEKEDTKEKDSISENLADDKVENSSNQKDFEEELNINTLQKNTQTEEQNKTNKELAEETINKKNTEDTKISEKGDPIQENNKTNKDVVENIVNNTTTESERKKYLNINKEEVEKPKEKEITKNKDIKHEEAKALYSPTKFQSRNAVNYSSRAADRKFKLSNQYVEIEEGNDIPTITVSGVKIGGRLFVPAGSSSTQNPDWIKIDIKSIRKTVTGRPVINDWKKGETSRDYMATIGWKANNSSETYVANIFIVVKRNMAISPEIPEVPIDTTAPEAPTVNRVTSEDSQVSGAAEAGSTVKV